jgi:hypothetical protein
MPSSIWVKSNDFFRTSSLSANCYKTNAKSFLYNDETLGYLLINITIRTKPGVLHSDKIGMLNLEDFSDLICKYLKNYSPVKLALENFSNKVLEQARHNSCSYYAFSIVISFNYGATYHTIFGPDIEVSAEGEDVQLGNLLWKKSTNQDFLIKTVEVPLSFHDIKNNADKVLDLVYPQITNVNQLPGWKHAEYLFNYIGAGSVTFLRSMWRVGATLENTTVSSLFKYQSNQSIPEVVSQKLPSTNAKRQADHTRSRNNSAFPGWEIFDEATAMPDDKDTCTIHGVGILTWEDAKLGRIETVRDEVTRNIINNLCLPDGRIFNIRMFSGHWRLHLWKLTS